MDNKRTVHKSKVMNEYGLTQEMIDRLLPEPEKIRNKRNKNNPILVWNVEDVETATESVKRRIKDGINAISVDEVSEDNLMKLLKIARIQPDNEEKVVYFIRHNLCSFDKHLFRAKGKGQLKSWFTKYHNTLLKKIIKAYPLYTNECIRQMRVD